MITALYHITHSISGGVHKTVNPTYGCNHRSDCFLHIIQTCWRRTVLIIRLRTASPQGMAALAAQGGVAILTEQGDWAFSVMQFFAEVK